MLGKHQNSDDPCQQPPPSQSESFLPSCVLLTYCGIMLFFSLFSLIFWVTVDQRDPQFSLESLSISNFNSSAPCQRLTATWNARFQVSNPNKKLSISYTRVVSSIFYNGSYLLTQTSIQPLYQGRRNVATVEASFSMADSYVDGRVVEGMDSDLRSSGQLIFDLKVGANVILRLGHFSSDSDLQISCNNVALSGLSGKMLGPPRKCSVYCSPTFFSP